jgi:hypothetical protein
MEDLIKAFQIFFKYSDNKFPTHCEHDYLYVDVSPDKVSQEDKDELLKLGFFKDEKFDGDGFGSFRFGSC